MRGISYGNIGIEIGHDGYIYKVGSPNNKKNTEKKRTGMKKAATKKKVVMMK